MIRLLLIIMLIGTQSFMQKGQAQKPADKPGQYMNGIYIPKDLDDCMDQFKRNWSDTMKVAFRKTPENQVLRKYSIVSDWLIANWGLYNDSRLVDYFNNFGLFHPEDMASIILLCYHRDLSGEELKLGQLIRHYKDYWKLQERSRPDIK